MIRPGNLIILIILITPVISFSQNGSTLPFMMKGDTVAYTLPQFEKQFPDSNLELLSQKYNITGNEALLKQAKIRDQFRDHDKRIGARGLKGSVTLNILSKFV